MLESIGGIYDALYPHRGSIAEVTAWGVALYFLVSMLNGFLVGLGRSGHKQGVALAGLTKRAFGALRTRFRGTNR
jgi:hypothetical protein